MSDLKDGAFTGNSNAGSPYEGDILKGIAYDRFEADTTLIEQEGPTPVILHMYQRTARKLIENLSAEPGSLILDIGSGTGISTLELLAQNPASQVKAVEMSKGMIQVARYKFHKSDGRQVLHYADDETLLKYWNEFREESERYSEQVDFINGDFQTIDMESDSVDAAVANQFMHWTELSKSFAQIQRFLKKDGEFVWNTASHFCEDPNFPSLQYGFRYNDFIGCVLDEVSKRFNVADYHTLSRPKHTPDSILAISEEQGMITEQVATTLVYFDLQVIMQNHIPAFVRQLALTRPSDDDELMRVTKDAIAKAANNPAALNDVTHKFDINPVFRSKRI